MKIFTFLKTTPSYFYQILYIEKGSGIHKIDFEDYEIQDNSVFLRPGQVHDLVFNHKNTKGFLINFNENLFNQFLYKQISLINYLYLVKVVRTVIIRFKTIKRT